MSGTISLSMTQQFNEFGKPLSGGLLYFVQAGTTATPQNAYQDSNLTLPWPNPITLDQAGRVPQFYLADGSIKIRLTDRNGVQQIVADNILVIGPSSGEGGGGSVDPTIILQTGALLPFYGTGARSGFVRCNARTIGSSTSGATERANADTEALFEYLWGVDANLSVSGGRGGSANADWSANKTIALPDGRNRAVAGLGDMGNSDAGLFTGVTFTSGDAVTLGSRLGAARRTLTIAQLPVVTPGGSVTIPAANLTIPGLNATGYNVGGQTPGTTLYGTSGGGSGLTATFPQISSSLIGTPFGSGQAHDTISPYMLITIYMKI
jgi:hypothetical protein